MQPQLGKETQNLTESQVQVFAVHEALHLDEYQNFTVVSDRSGTPGIGGLDFVLLGLFGEVGSLLSALKKKKRDKDAYMTYQDSVLEEIGDVLWYLANAAGRVNLKFSELAFRALQVSPLRPSDTCEVQTFTQLQAAPSSNQTIDDIFEIRLIELAAKCGALLDSFSSRRFEQNIDRLAADLIEVFRALIRAANYAHVDLNLAAQRNILKSEGRWPQTRTWGKALTLSFLLRAVTAPDDIPFRRNSRHRWPNARTPH